MINIKTVTAIPAGGKTYSTINLINNSSSLDKFVVVNIGQKLAEQTFNAITLPKWIAVTNTTGGRPVGAQIEKALRERVRIVVCCHEGFMKVDPSLLAGYTVIIDEVPVSINLDDLPVKDNEDILRVLSQSCNIDGCKYSLHPDHGKEKIEVFRAQCTRSDKMMDMLTALELGGTVTRMGDHEFRWSVVFDWVEHLQHAEKVYMLAAQIEGLATYELMKAQGAAFVPTDDIKPKFSAYQNPERIKVIPLLTGINYTKGRCVDGETAFKVDAEGNYKPDGSTIYTQMRENAKAALKHYNKDKFTYTVNKKQKDESWGYEKATGVAYNPHGRNDLREYEAVVCIYQANLNNQQKTERNEIADKHGIDRKVLEQSFINQIYHEPVFQAATRGAIRNHEDTETVYVVIVPDERAANYLVDGHFKGAELVLDFSIDGKKVGQQYMDHQCQQELQTGTIKLTPNKLRIPAEYWGAFNKWKSVTKRKRKQEVVLEDCIYWMNQRDIPTDHLTGHTLH